VIFKPVAGAWDWSQTSRLVIPVENPANEALTLLLCVEDNASRSVAGRHLTGGYPAGCARLFVGTLARWELSRQPFRLADPRGGRGLRPLVRRRKLQSLQVIDRQ
jgi:hypothetical protein